ncbi:glycosyltransferase family 2 protein [bacterium]|nr:glycosyltransferase family 2 protein [bacterium]
MFVYSRPLHTRQTVEALQKNELAKESDLLIFSDAPKHPEAIAAVQAVREYIKTVGGFKSVSIVERDENLGLADSIIDGVTRLCNEYGRVIVMEDDLVTSPFFLRYINDTLDTYADDERVASVHGYWYPVDRQMSETFFLRGASCWGWATWSRAWQLFEPDGRKLLADLQRQKLTRVFDLDGAIAYTQMLKDQIAVKNNSWAIRWHAATFLANRMQLSPGVSLVRNVGFDGSGIHSGESDAYAVNLSMRPITVRKLPAEQSHEARAALIRYYIKTRRSIFERAIGRLRRLIDRIKK